MALTRRFFLSGLIACPICAGAARADQAHWTYEGTDGPAQWGKLDKAYGVCSIGGEQSPIDLRNAVKAQIEPLALDWKPQTFAVINNGHTIQANAAPGSGLTLAGKRYELKQFHFHTPGEHAVDGKFSQMEAHFVHASADGKLVVVGMLMRPGKVNAAFKAVMAAAPGKEGKSNPSAVLDPKLFLPANSALYRYEGSLTTPPCAETVNWNVYASEIEAAGTDIDAFHALFAMNARPLQPLNRRVLLKSS